MSCLQKLKALCILLKIRCDLIVLDVLEKNCVQFRVQGESLVHAHFHFTGKNSSCVFLCFERKKKSIEIMYLGFRCGKFFVVVFER